MTQEKHQAEKLSDQFQKAIFDLVYMAQAVKEWDKLSEHYKDKVRETAEKWAPAK